ncbi:MAG: shikimate dehydrogenase [Actinobacteria bacterium]|nr:shikimate dehydrogenase [Actinomycetota bacterium]
MLKLAVLGSPINHSLSPQIHSEAYRLLGIEASYERFQVEEESFSTFMKSHADWNGFSLTMPLKSVGVEVCKSLSDSVMATGAVNTLIARDSSWFGYNTDVLGFEFLLQNRDLRSVSVLGAGGTAKAALFALGLKGFGATVYRRNPQRDSLLMKSNPKVEIRPWDEVEEAFSSKLLINALPNSAFDSELKMYRAKGDVMDSLYHPWPTPLGLTTDTQRYSSGKDLLVAQALFQIELFANVTIEKEEFFSQLRSKI